MFEERKNPKPDRHQISVKAQQMMSACGTALRGNPGNAFLHFLPNLAFERRPPHARHVFLSFYTSYACIY
jgi:hypothetical protein